MTLLTKGAQIDRDLNLCLKAAATLSPFLYKHEEDKLDDGCFLAATTSFIRTCNKLDDLMDKLGEADETLEKSALRMMDSQAAANVAQEAASNALRRPSCIFRPELRRHPSGDSWCAVYGDTSDLEACIIGVGTTPEAAMEDFDLQWSEATQMPKTNTKVSRKKAK